MKLMRNTTAVLVLTLFTGLAVFTAIQLGGRLFGTPTASAQTVTTQAVQGQSGSSTGQSSSGSTQSDPNGYGSSSGSGSSSGGQTYTCPATGCTASTCHATQ
jgi:hypothetical protein